MTEEKEKNGLVYLTSWERQIRLIIYNKTLLKSAQKELKQTITYLRKEFGEDFLINPKNKTHFLVRKLIHEKAGIDGYHWLLWFVDSYKKIKSIFGKDVELLKQLRHEKKDANSALTELIHIDKFLRSNYFVCKLHPERKKINEKGKTKTKRPELEVKINYSNFLFDVEVKELHKEGLKSYLMTYFLLHESILKQEVNRIYIAFSFVLFTPDIEKTEINKINKQIESDILEVVANKSVKYFEDEHLIKYVIGHVYKEDEVKKWCRENDASINSMSLAPSQLDPAIASIKAKIERDIMNGNLLFSDYGLGIINDANLFSMNFMEEQKDFKKIVKNVQQSIQKFPNLIGVIISSSLFFTLQPHHSTEFDNYVVIGNDNDPNNLYYIIIWNNNLEITFSQADKQAIVDAFKADTSKRIHKLKKPKIHFEKN